jgi:glycosyltransferase involved in cell wall biosynthesis
MMASWPAAIKRQGIALYLPSLDAGGAERATIDLANALSRLELPVQLVVGTSDGLYRSRVEPSVTLVDLHSRRMLHTILPLMRYLKKQQPAALISALDHANVAALLAVRGARATTKTIITLRSSVSQFHLDSAGRRNGLLPAAMRLLYPSASAIVAVSRGVAEDYVATIGIPEDKTRVIYNPVVTQKMLQASTERFEHPWFAPTEPPVLLSVGRLTAAKDFPTLLKAFVIVRRRRRCRLLILGEGEERPMLEDLAHTLELGDDFALPGFVRNPYVFMRHAAVYVLSSVLEGLPGALIEAMACMTRVVATDCPNGPREILDNGRYGALVPVQDTTALAAAIEQAFASSAEVKPAYERALLFSEERALTEYQALLARLVEPT